MSDKRFTLVLSIVGAITALSGLIMGAIAIWGPNPLPPATAAVFETLKTVFILGTGTICGLLPGKLTAQPDKPGA